MAKKAKKVPVHLKRRPRRAFKSFETQGELQLHVINYKGKRRIIKPFRLVLSAKRKFLEHSILHLLFPKNSIEPVGITVVELNGRKYSGMVSEIVKNRSSDYKEFQKLFYSDFQKETPSVLNHKRFCKKIADPLSQEIVQQTGILVNSHNINICNVKGTPVFFEVTGIVGKKRLSEYISSKVTNVAKRERLEKLLKEFEALYH